VPFGQLNAPAQLTGRVTVSALFWGFAGVCEASALTATIVGLLNPDPPVVTVQQVSLFLETT
jgi:hypothetical protein